MIKSRIALGLGDTPEASSSSLQRFSSYMSKYLMKEFTVIHVLELLGDKFLVFLSPISSCLLNYTACN